MKKTLLLLFLSLNFFGFGQAVLTNPSPFEVNQSVTITIDQNTTDTDCNHLNNPNKVYMHAGVGDDSNPWQYVVGNWGQDDGIGEMTDNGDGTWSITIVPQTYFGLTNAQAAGITKMGLVFRNEDGSQEYKNNGCSDFILNVGAFQVTMINPDDTGIIIVEHNGSTQILAQNTNGNANYELFANGISVHTQNNVNFYNGYQFQNLTENQYCELVVTQGSSVVSKKFTILVNDTSQQALPSNLEDGINYDTTDPTKATLVLTAPHKDFVYVAGNFNNWQPDHTYALKKDPNSDKFWVEIDGLSAGTNYTYQYWVAKVDPIADSPKLVKTADPFSTLVLSPFDDPYIPASSYPNLPAYPAGQEREVTVLKTGEPAYNWQVTNFNRPDKDKLAIYEVLIRDFDANRNFQDLIDKVNYFKNLNVNAIELMPVMEFEGNEGWGYNPDFHLALDKFYGTKNKLKELIDLYHQNGIAVILDVALNHAFGRNPMERMWMIDADGDGWGPPSSENPYFNQQATHAYGIGYDFNHSSPYTQYYTERVIKHWITEFHIDGFRWDLTKGFTQNCTSGDEACTNAYQADRVAVLKHYADYTWSVDPDSYVIFEHLGNAQEEQEWANYRYNEGKGIMLWGRYNEPYNELTMGQNGNKNFDGMGYIAHNFSGKRLVGYFESHDEERLMYNNLQYGNTANSIHNVQNLNTALYRMRALGAVSLLIPGPKMIWDFGDLGMNLSINTCTDGTVDPNCRLATKPQPQWVEDWLHNTHRNAIYDDWSKMLALKRQEPVFNGSYEIHSGSFTPIIYIWDDNIPVSQLKNVIIVANFDVFAHTVNTGFPYTGTWYNLMDNSSINVTSSNVSVDLQPGEYRIFGNQPGTVSATEYSTLKLNIYPNPADHYIAVDQHLNKLEIYNLSGQCVKKFVNHKTYFYNIQDLKSGFYLLKAYKNNKIALKKIIINHQ